MGNCCASFGQCCKDFWCCNYRCCRAKSNDSDKIQKSSVCYQCVYSKVKDEDETDHIPLPKLPSDDDGTTGVLKVQEVDLCLSENGTSHHTDKYDQMITTDQPKLVVRRGQPFLITLTFSRPYDSEKDGVSFVLSIVDGKPSMSHGTLIVIPLLSKTGDEHAWSASIESIDHNKVKVRFKVSASCSIGKWKLAVDTKLLQKLRDDASAVSFTLKDPIYILYNPWNSDDQVYMDSEDSLAEYVLEDTGMIWRGSHNRLRPTPWAYSQFEKDVLDCALYLLSGPGHLSSTARTDAVRTVRAISAAVNSPDEDGVLEGNWTEDFKGGVPPTQWTGSLKILQKYYSSKKPVKFGQCWVFAGVVTTICRVLGIPSRPVTNYSSAHDTQNSLTVDYFFDLEGKAVENLNTDSVWNFHVWNEIWTNRPDLDSKGKNVYSGWQVIDATPQERSDEMYRCGPASVVATRMGEIRRPFDGAFVFSEVNADKVYWHYRGVNRPLKLLGKKAEAIGMLISTKAVGKFEREDITDKYKHPEKTTEERETMLKALKDSESLFSRYYLNEDFNDIRFDFQLRDDIVIGSPFRVILTIKNVNEKQDYQVSVSLRVDTMLYTGKIKDLVKKEHHEKLEIAANSEKDIFMDVVYGDYAPKLCDQCAFNVACLAKVAETEFEYFAQDDFRVRKPDIKFQILGKDKILVGKAFTGTIMLTNPLPVALKKGRFLIEGPGLGDPLKIKLKETVQPHKTVETDFSFTPRLEGEKTLSAKFTSHELEDVDGFVTITVTSNEESSVDNNTI